jgi:hypothetical protein
MRRRIHVCRVRSLLRLLLKETPPAHSNGGGIQGAQQVDCMLTRLGPFKNLDLEIGLLCNGSALYGYNVYTACQCFPVLRTDLCGLRTDLCGLLPSILKSQCPSVFTMQKKKVQYRDYFSESASCASGGAREALCTLCTATTSTSDALCTATTSASEALCMCTASSPGVCVYK